jgi:glyoxylase-like metal-dependent hydrolase (beta-lactamase superfamily II)
MKQALLASVFALALVSCATPTREQSLVSRAVEAIGGAERLAGLKTISVKGNVKHWEPEQSDVPGGEPRFAAESTFEFVQDVSRRAARTDWVKNFAYPAPRTFTYSEIVTPEAGYVLGVDSNARNAENLKMSPPAHSMSGLRLATTHREGRRGAIGPLLRAMQQSPDKVQPAADIGGQPAVSFEGFIVAFDPATGLPSRVRTLDYDNIWGDVNYDLLLSGWRDFGGMKIATDRKYELNGRVVIETKFTDVTINPSVDAARFEVPAEIRTGAARPAATRHVPYQWVIRRQFIGVYLDSDNLSYDTRASQGLRLQEVAPGVHHVQGGTHNSLVVEMSDHLIVIDAPMTDAQSLWLVGATRARFPGKPIRWLALTHHHMDHAGGLRGILAEGGVTLVVGQGAGAHFRRVLEAPMTRNFDLPARSFHMTPILEVPESHVMSDARGRQVIVYVMENPHAKGMLLGWVPDAKLGFVTDVWTPGPPLPAKPNPGLVSVVNTVKRAGLQPERFAGGHGSTADYQMLTRLVGQ